MEPGCQHSECCLTLNVPGAVCRSLCFPPNLFGAYVAIYRYAGPVRLRSGLLCSHGMLPALLTGPRCCRDAPEILAQWYTEPQADPVKHGWRRSTAQCWQRVNACTASGQVPISCVAMRSQQDGGCCAFVPPQAAHHCSGVHSDRGEDGVDSDPLRDYREQRVTLLHVLSRSHCENSVTPYAVHILCPRAASALCWHSSLQVLQVR